MWLSLNITSDIVDIKDLDSQEIADRLTMSTAEIDDIDYLNHHLKSIFTARIIDILPHPNADKLTLVDLDTGRGSIRVVCGASNPMKGDIVAMATIGTRFTEDFIVKKTTIRGEESNGMLCSEKELGLSDDHSGLMILPKNTPLGLSLSELFPHWMDTRFEIDNKSITHRPDLWGHVGFAREIAAIFGRDIRDVIDYNIQQSFRDTDRLIVAIKNPDAAPRYCGLLIRNIEIKESPDWLKAKVIAIGMRPINNIVDITNYVMAEIGEPMHAFDRNKLKGDSIVVRMAKDGESLNTIDGMTRILTPDDIVIADQVAPIALAGVMGGIDSEIDSGTCEIVLEAANFNPIRIRKTSSRFNLRTEAAIRFEKSLDPNLCSSAIFRCYDLIKRLIPKAEASTPIVDSYPGKPNKIYVNTSYDFIRKRLGIDMDDKRINNILTSLDFKIQNKNDDIRIEIPSHRATGDISIPEDIVEEVGRIYGYDNISPKAPYVPCITPHKNEMRSFERLIKEILTRDHNIVEVSNYSFVSEKLLNLLKTNEDKELHLKNPLSQEQDRLRRSLIPNLINNIELNQRYNETFRIFELGRVYLKEKRKSSELAREERYVSGLVFSKKAEDPLFYDAKNIVIDLLEQLSIMNVKYSPARTGLPSYAHPARSMNVLIDNKNIGLIFELHPEIIDRFEIKGKAGIFDLNVSICFNSQKREKIFVDLQKYPEVPFEISVLADKYQNIDSISSIIQKSNSDCIKSVDVISIYDRNPIPEGMKSVSFKIVFASRDKTLSPDEIDMHQKRVIGDLKKNGYQLR
ncbi:MAG: phenylalanine--tRNA ligase subunit beta [Spirochaetota bacterium]|nr:phenylalanine--tRNA ligase subunit beta [Spirochaetota bacterium]